ncbi:20697_t:CDS:2 [Cetraspora pellucida]|uniref:20697_t:CDS:1 n=1 Tax=Cetraspora pellucida TaxID=1433469 RepID=A0A9N9HX02_9GLOM|nr:20697_t:CDS:2 [Cetraspora pellucida]
MHFFKFPLFILFGIVFIVYVSAFNPSNAISADNELESNPDSTDISDESSYVDSETYLSSDVENNNVDEETHKEDLEIKPSQFGGRYGGRFGGGYGGRFGGRYERVTEKATEEDMEDSEEDSEEDVEEDSGEDSGEELESLVLVSEVLIQYII